MKQHRARKHTLGAALVVTSVLAAGCSSSGGGGSAGAGSSPGVTDTEISLGSYAPLTGVAAASLSNLPAGTAAYFDYVNDEGGVQGRTINFTNYDDAYNPTTTSQVVRRLVLQDDVFALVGGVGTATSAAVLDFVTANEVPSIVMSGGTVFDDPEKYPTTFGFLPSIDVEGKIIGYRMQNDYAGQRWCSLGQQGELNDQGVAGLEAVLDEGQLAAQVDFAPTDTTLETQVATLKSADCDVVAYFGISAFAGLFVKTASATGFDPVILGTSNNNDLRALTNVLGSPDLLTNFYATQFMPGPGQPDDGWTQAFQDIWDQYGNGAPYDNYIAYGIAVAYVTVQALQAAGADLTREGFIDALENGAAAEGPGYTPAQYSPSVHGGYAGLITVKAGPTGFTPEGPIYSTGSGDAAVETSTAPPVEAPAGGLPDGVGE